MPSQMPQFYFTKMIPLRWPFYTFTLLSVLFLTFVALNAPPYDAKSFPPFATACAVLAIVTSLWICILLCYGRSETEYEHALTRCYTHIISFAVIAMLWFGIGVFFAIHADIECRHRTVACMSLWASAVLAFLAFLSSCLCVAIVVCPVVVAGVGYDTHVEDARVRAQNRVPETEDVPVDQIDMPLISRPQPVHIS